MEIAHRLARDHVRAQTRWLEGEVQRLAAENAMLRAELVRSKTAPAASLAAEPEHGE